MHPQRWRFLGILVGSIDRFWCITFRRVTFLPTGHFFTFLVISISRFTFGDFSHIYADFSNTFINFRRLLIILHELFIDFIAFSVSKEYKWKHSLWQIWVDCCLRTNVCSFINHKLALTKLGGSTFFAPWTIIAGYKCRKGKYWEF